ncbi:hypothetical protein J6590_045359 [Homalodisca vitripennis]|nr:hypothetical protein J6590_045359 [Homalodisca vitripennis]
MESVTASDTFLRNPYTLTFFELFTIIPWIFRKNINLPYYEFDNTVIRELLGKKLTSRHRKDLDEVSEKTGVSLKSCRRQFDNVKRVFKTVEELQGSVVTNIKNLFLLPDELARFHWIKTVNFVSLLVCQNCRQTRTRVRGDTVQSCSLLACDLKLVSGNYSICHSLISTTAHWP